MKPTCCFLVLLLALAVPALADPQATDPPQVEKKKARKVWTNDDFAPAASMPEEPEPEQAPAAEAPPRPLEVLFAELDSAREELAGWRVTLENYRQAFEAVVERRRNADNDYDRDAYEAAIPPAEEQLIGAEEKVKQLEARVAELEQLTKGKKRPATKAAPRDLNPQQLKEIPQEVVGPGGGPAPARPEAETETPPPPPAP